MTPKMMTQRAYDLQVERMQLDIDRLHRREQAPTFTPPTEKEIRETWVFEDVTLRNRDGVATKMAMAVKTTTGTLLRFIVEMDVASGEWVCYPPNGYGHPAWASVMICAVQDRVFGRRDARLAN
jgi:hypothetical protein